MGSLHKILSNSPCANAQEGYLGCRVLLVEDDEAVRGITARMLQQLGFQIVEASDGAEALRVVQDLSSIALLFTDVVMPNMDGSELAARLRRKNPSLPVVFMSGYAEALRGKFELQIPDALYLEKPFGAHEVGDVIHRVMSAEPEGDAT